MHNAEVAVRLISASQQFMCKVESNHDRYPMLIAVAGQLRS